MIRMGSKDLQSHLNCMLEKPAPTTWHLRRAWRNCKLEIVYAKEGNDMHRPESASPIQNYQAATLKSLIKKIYRTKGETEFRGVKETSEIHNSNGSMACYRKYREQNLMFWRKRGIWYSDTLSIAHYCSNIVAWVVDELIAGMADDILSAVQLHEHLVEEFKES